MHQLARPACLALLGLFAFSAGARADVLILEAPELGAFSNPQAAVTQAPEGATLLFGKQSVDGFVIDGKSLTLVGPGIDPITVRGKIEIHNLAPNQSVRLQNLWIQGDSSLDLGSDSGEVGLQLQDCLGAVRITGCRIDGGEGVFDFDSGLYPDGGAALVIENSSDVALTACLVQGGAGGGFSNSQCCTGGAGGVGLDVESSELALYDCVLRGGSGGDAGIFGGNAGDGMRTVDARVFASGCSFEGGNGGDSVDFLFSVGGDGGDGLVAAGLPRPRLLDSGFQGGLGGFGLDAQGTPGIGRTWDMGGLPALPGAHRGLRVIEPIVLSGETFAVELEGLMGDGFFIAAALQDARAQTFSPPGVRLVPKPTLLPTVPQATLTTDGTQSLSLPGLGIPQGLDSATWMIQGFVKDAGGQLHIAGAGLVTMFRRTAQPDCIGSGVWDVYEALTVDGVDCDGNLELDPCQTTPDCNLNGIADGIETACFGATDDNGNGVPDECETDAVLFVDLQSPAGGDGSFIFPFRSLREAFDAALDGATIRLFDGTYSGPDNRELFTSDRSLRIESLGGEGACTIDLEGQGRFVVADGFGSVRQLEMRGLRVINGWGLQGGAIAIFQQDALLEGCSFRNNTATFRGGAVSLAEASLTLRDCEFQGNTTATGGSVAGIGGAVAAQGDLMIERCVFDSNTADFGGAVVVLKLFGFTQTPARISHSIFRLNHAVSRGGAIYNVASMGDSQGISLEVDHGFLGFNTSGNAGGAYYGTTAAGPDSFDSAGRFTSCTMVENGATGIGGSSGGGAIYLGAGAGAQVFGSILWANSASVGSQVRAVGTRNRPAEVVVQASTVQGGAPGVGLSNGSTLSFSGDSLSSDPLFMGAPNDYRLGAGSPCIDSMSPALLNLDFGDVDGNGNTEERVPLDLLGGPRRVDDPNAPDLGLGAAPLPDMGAFERQP